ncbi:hypothetical protein GOP47_0029005 [Adiantum capillus-veneris]|nr:hypothetical protein GOP47_0029005 [Adiantum capillus-veneris]
MVGALKDVLEAQKGLSLYQYVETMRTFLNELQSQTTKKGLLSHRKTAPIGLFCMSGPVAHADDDEDEDTEIIDSTCNVKTAPKSLESKPWVVGKKYMNSAQKDVNMTNVEKIRVILECNDNGLLHRDNIVKQRWANGCVYEGNWGPDQQTGRGKISWPSGSSYDGEVVKGSLHGVGTYKGADGTIYKGNWKMNKKHGFGWKKYANGDVYEGAWKWDVPEGQGRYFWSNGSEYYGGWKNGVMSGRGVLVWSSGDKYDGHWLHGLADGHGVYTWADGSIYFGTWRKGLKHGKGRFFPPGSKYVESDGLSSSYPVCIEEEDDSDVDLENSGRQKVCSPSHVPQELRRSGLGLPPDELTLGMVATSLDICEDSSLVLERLWRLENSAAFLPSVNDVTYSSKCVFEDSDENFSYGDDLSVSEGDYNQPKWLMEEKKRPGETISKDHRNYELMMSLQLGIRHSVGKVTLVQKKKVVPADFGSKARTKVSFPREGSQVTPPHQAVDFKWKDYRPTVFRHLRELFNVDAADYMLSICGNNGLRELSSPGKSGSVFYLTQDERFMIKTLRKAEVKVLLRMLPRYYNHVQTYKNTLLTRFLGLHRFKNASGQKVRFIIMGNVVCSDSWIHRRFDLKGSSQGRSAEKEETDESATLKDLDLEFVFQLDQSWRDAVLDQISKDCKFLESEHIMDYSLLLGLHFKESPSREATDSRSSVFDLPLHDVVLSRFVAESGGFVEVEVIPSQLTCKKSRFEQDNDLLRRQGSLKNTGEEGKINLLFSKDESRDVQIGYNMPAKAHRRLASGKADVNSKEAYSVLLYFGVIDILQEYDMGKKLEHAYKSFQFDSLSISAVDPVLYSKRFQQFMHEIFLADT